MENCYTREQIEKAMNGKGHKYFHHGAYNVNIIGVRNAATGDEITNKFDDCMTISYKDDNGDWHFNCWKCTTDPGKYWAEHLLNKDGVAILKEGQYRGSHKIRKHQGKYDALCQKGPVKVYRDKNMDDEYDLIEENVHEGVYGINIHKAGSWKSGSVQVDKWSAGCQVFSKEDDFYDFMNVMYKSRDRWGNSFTYTLINSKDVS
jgi:hypothetical protein|tara:strand:- start:221 stop:832 length:612 start_codon:yes stop_codon:yes gene_type:complete